jgi:hypothetical protein
MNGWLKFPVSDVPGFVGFFLLTVASVAIAKRVPGLKRLV